MVLLDVFFPRFAINQKLGSRERTDFARATRPFNEVATKGKEGEWKGRERSLVAGKRRLFVELFIMERRTRQEGRGSSPLHLLHLGILVPDALFLGKVVVDIKPRDASF